MFDHSTVVGNYIGTRQNGDHNHGAHLVFAGISFLSVFFFSFGNALNSIPRLVRTSGAPALGTQFGYTHSGYTRFGYAHYVNVGSSWSQGYRSVVRTR